MPNYVETVLDLVQDYPDNTTRAINCHAGTSHVICSSCDAATVAERSRFRIVAGLVTSPIPVPLKTRRVGQRCPLYLLRAETSSRRYVVVVRRGGCQLMCRPRHLTKVQNYVVRRQKPSCI
ncbi:uncharacterized protein TNCV_4398881 [Trichonephila clavipes]|nr:uncharacterized protein TNCV_4398881 [Trichonephila clavipes]